MKTDNPFDKKLEAQKRVIPSDLQESLVYVTDTLDVCWAAARAVFEKDARPEHALAIYSLAEARLPSAGRKRSRKATAGPD